MARVIIVGEDDPYGKTPLQPDIIGSSGQRLWKMSGLSMTQYVTHFERRNLFKTGESKSINLGRNRARVILGTTRNSDIVTYVICLGRVVAGCFDLSYDDNPLFFVKIKKNVVAAYLPHTSGLNRWYNSTDNAESATDFMQTMGLVASGRLEEYPGVSELLS